MLDRMRRLHTQNPGEANGPPGPPGGGGGDPQPPNPPGRNPNPPGGGDPDPEDPEPGPATIPPRGIAGLMIRARRRAELSVWGTPSDGVRYGRARQALDGLMRTEEAMADLERAGIGHAEFMDRAAEGLLTIGLVTARLNDSELRQARQHNRLLINHQVWIRGFMFTGSDVTALTILSGGNVALSYLFYKAGRPAFAGFSLFGAACGLAGAAQGAWSGIPMLMALTGLQARGLAGLVVERIPRVVEWIGRTVAQCVPRAFNAFKLALLGSEVPLVDDGMEMVVSLPPGTLTSVTKCFLEVRAPIRPFAGLGINLRVPDSLARYYTEHLAQRTGKSLGRMVLSSNDSRINMFWSSLALAGAIAPVVAFGVYRWYIRRPNHLRE